MIRTSKLRKEFGTVKAVDDLNLEIYKGEIFGLLGPNGAGKTTSIRCILNVIKPDSGEIFFDNKPIDKKFLSQVGYLPEERGLYSKSKVIDVISYFAELKGIPVSSAKKEGKRLLKKLDIPQYENKKVNELSKGNQQKIQLITALVHDPKVLILDEPFSGLDPINQQIVKDLLLELLEQGKTIIFSTHQMDVAEKLCNRITLINKGKEVLNGTISEVKKSFGKTSLLIKFTDGEFDHKKYEEIQSADVYESSAEIILNPNVEPQKLLKKLINDVQLISFDITEPSLHSIFIDTISKFNKN